MSWSWRVALLASWAFLAGSRGCPENHPPLAVDDAVETRQGVPVTIDVLANDTDPDGDELHVFDVSSASHGEVSSPDGLQVLYAPSPEFVGTDQFTVTIQDARAKTATSEVVVTVVGNAPPTAVLHASAVVGRSPFTVVFDGSASSDPEGPLAAHHWDFGDGQTAAGAVASHTYDGPGSYMAVLTVTDGEGAEGAAWVEILVARNVLPNSDFEAGDHGVIDHWTTTSWREGPLFTWAEGEGRSGSRAVRIDIAPEVPNDAAWIKPIQLDPNMPYNLYGWIRGQDVQGGGMGANLSVYGTFDGSSAEGSTGNFDFREVVFTFVTDSTGQATLACRAGFWGSTVSGTVWCDDLFLTVDDFAPREQSAHFAFRLERNDLVEIDRDHFVAWLAGLDAAYDAYAELVGGVPFEGERLGVQSVRQYPGGWAVAGNPIRWMQQYVGPELAEIDETGSLSFGTLHEIGHAFELEGRWSFQSEVVASFEMVYVVEQLDAIVRPASVFYRGAELREAYWVASDEGTTPGWPLVVYRLIELTDEVGWEPFRQAFRALSALSPEDVPATPRAKFDELMSLVAAFSGVDVLARFPSAELAWLYDQLD